MTLQNKTFSAVRWTSTSAIFKGLLQVAQLAVLARILAPKDFGLMALVTVVLGFATLFADLGLNSAYIQRQDVTPTQRSSLFWLNISVSLLLMLLVMLSSSFLANFFGDERLIPLLILSSTIFIVAALGQQIRANATKNLEFKRLALTEISAALIGFIIAVGCALTNFGVYALVYGAMTSALTSSLLSWVFIAKGWHPQLHFNFNEIKPYFSFGGAVVANGIVNQFNMSMDLLIGGRLLGATQLGLFSVSRNLILQIQFLINPISTRVGFPLIAQIQYDIPRVRSVYLQTVNLTASVNAPIYLGLVFFAPEIIHVILGSNWSGSVELLRILAIWGLFRSLANPVGSLLLGMGHADLSLKWNLGLLFLVFPFLWFGSQWGITGMAWSMLAFQIVVFVPGWYLLVKPLCEATIIDYSKVILKPFIITLLSVTLAYLIKKFIQNQLVVLIIAFLVFSTTYYFMSKKFNQNFTNSLVKLVMHRNT